MRWDSDASYWVEDDVETPTGASIQVNSLPYVHCRLNVLAPVALFEGPEQIEPTCKESLFAFFLSFVTALDSDFKVFM